jgi:endonuclease III
MRAITKQTPATKPWKLPKGAPDLGAMLEVLDSVYTEHPMGNVTTGVPYKVLMGCILSLRTKDEVTIPACERLFAVADTPETLVQLPVETIERLIYPCGFYKTKAHTLRTVSQTLLEQFNGQTPNTIEALLTLKGVGRKTANLVMSLGHGLPAICVDSHVHRMCNRMGYVQTQTPDETEFALRATLAVPYWNVINRIMVLHGREICKPIGARCDVCPVAAPCLQVEVKKRKPPKPNL